MKQIITLSTAIFLLSACQASSNKVKQSIEKQEPITTSTPSEVLAASKPTEWRKLDADNTLYMQLENGLVVIELLPDMAPMHVENTKALVREGVFDGTNFYRVIDGFVAQGGPLYQSEEALKPLQHGSYEIAEEFTYDGDISGLYTPFDDADGYADETGFVKSFAVGKDHATQESWMLHCYGALGMGRTNDVNSGGTALYIVNGPSQRYLDRNTTVFGRVIEGMAHIQALQRGGDLNGPIDLSAKNIIESIQVAADLSNDQMMNIEVLDSQSESFRNLLKARKNRTGDWFKHQHDYMDACGVPIPARFKS